MNERNGGIAACLFGATLVVFGGCITVPDVVLVENKTALEKQASGEFRSLDLELQRAGLNAGPENITRGQLDGKNKDLRESTLGEIVRLYSAVQSDAERIDHFLVAQCLGEANTGFLVETRDQCTEDINPAEVTALLERSNRNRRQIWRDVMAKVKMGSPENSVRNSWRKRYLQRVVCGAQIEDKTGQWEVKKCEE